MSGTVTWRIEAHFASIEQARMAQEMLRNVGPHHFALTVTDTTNEQTLWDERGQMMWRARGPAVTALTVVAPTDAQLGYIASLCREWGWQPPGAVHSKQEASEIIAAMQDGSYAPERYAPDADLPDVLRAT